MVEDTPSQITPGVVGAQHRFHDAEFVRAWADRFAPTPPRLALFALILAELSQRELPSAHVVELGIGPGYMARYILERNTALRYEGVDFSAEMFDIARETIGSAMDRVTLTNADLLDAGWPDALAARPGAIISTWALHDLGSEAAIASVYAGCRRALPPGGVLLNGDFIKPDGTAFEYEGGRIPAARHLAILAEAGFAEADCLAYFEPNAAAPTAGNNYACFRAVC